MINDAIIEEIKYRNDIVDVISSYVTLKRAGSNMLGLCPFHSEKTPSFTVFPQTRNFYCFGCGAGGDVITFIMKYENLDYISAVEFLAKRVGIAIPESPREDKPLMKRQRMYDMNREAAKFFRKCLVDPAVGKSAMDYLQSRKLSASVITHFGLGYAPLDYGMLRSYLNSKGYTDEELTLGFLCAKKNNRTFDYFRGRVIFPIIDLTGNVIAFGGRVLDDSLPKYLNTSDTPAFKKSRNLFALNFAKNFCKDELILCEGYMDVIALHAAGFENAVATLGTAITPDQARLISRYTKKVIISYDSDSAGQKAANKAMKLLTEVGLDVRVLVIPDAKDPDEYIKKFGKDKFKLVISNSKSQFEYKYNNVVSKYNLNNIDEKIKAVEELGYVISEVYSEVERDIYVSTVARKLEINAESMKADIKRIISKRKKEQKKELFSNAVKSVQRFGDKVNPDSLKNIRATAAEEVILGLLLFRPEYLDKVASGKLDLSPADFFTQFGRRVLENLLLKYRNCENFDYGMLSESFSPDEMGRLESFRVSRASLSDNTEQVLTDSIKVLKEEKLKALEDVSDSEDLVLGQINKIINDKKNQ